MIPLVQFEHTIRNISNFQPCCSAPFEFQSAKWSIEINRLFVGSTPYLQTSLYCNFGKMMEVWNRRIAIGWRVRRSRGRQDDFERFTETWQDNCTRGPFMRIPWSRLNTPRFGYIINESITIECAVFDIAQIPGPQYFYSETRGFDMKHFHLLPSEKIVKNRHPFEKFTLTEISKMTEKVVKTLGPRDGITWGVEFERDEDRVLFYLIKLDSEYESFDLEVVWRTMVFGKVRAEFPEAGFKIFANGRRSGRRVWLRIRECTEDGLVVDDSVTLQISIKMLKISKVKSSRTLEESTSLADLPVRVGDITFHLHKNTLGGHSLYFQRTLNKKQKGPVVLKDVNEDEFQTLVNIIYFDNEINLLNVDSLLRLARQFEMPYLRNECVQFLLEAPMLGAEPKRQYLDKMGFGAARKFYEENPRGMTSRLYDWDIGERTSVEHADQRVKGARKIMELLHKK